MSRSRHQTLTAISLFTGVGGLDFGLEAAGFETAVAVEFDPTACRTIRLNRRWPLVERDIHTVASSEILGIAGLKVGQADLLVGGPPCQPFSKAGYWKSGDARRLDDPRADTLAAYLRVLRDTKPRAFLLENVPGLAFVGKDDGLTHLVAGIDEVNRTAGTKYQVSWQKLNAADFGVPQTRERVFLVGARDGTKFSFPAPRYFPQEQNQPGRQNHRTAWDALGDLPADGGNEDLIVRGKWAELLPSVPEGQNYLWHTTRGGGEPLFGWRTRYWSFLLKLAKDRPAWTIQAQPGPAIGPFHWNNRRLSAQELCRLQTFPDDLEFDCSRNEVQRLLGNAVPSLLTEVLGREIRRQLLGDALASSRLKLLPSIRGKPPQSEYVYPVPKKYRSLIGEYADHPGEGLGRGAVAAKRPAHARSVTRKSAAERG
jgi:DNA (cytosine-5)-methyltransferase 1